MADTTRHGRRDRRGSSFGGPGAARVGSHTPARGRRISLVGRSDRSEVRESNVGGMPHRCFRSSDRHGCGCARPGLGPRRSLTGHRQRSTQTPWEHRRTGIRDLLARPSSESLSSGDHADHDRDSKAKCTSNREPVRQHLRYSSACETDGGDQQEQLHRAPCVAVGSLGLHL